MLGKLFVRPEVVALVFGFSCSLTWLLIALRAGILMAASHDPLALHVPFYLSCSVSATVMLLFAGALLRDMRSLTQPGPLLALPTAMVAAATIMLLFITRTTFMAELLSAFCGLLAGLGFALLLMQWCSVWNKLGFSTIVFCAVAAWSLCELFFFIFLFFDPIAAVVGSVVLLAAATLTLGYTANRVEPVPPFGHIRTTSARSMTARLAVLALVFGFFNEFTRLTYIQSNTALEDSLSFAGAAGLALLLMTLVTLLTVALPLLLRRKMSFEPLYRLVLILSVAGVLLLAVPEVPVVLAYALNLAAFLCLGITLWATLVCLSRRFPGRAALLYGIVLAAWMAGPVGAAQLNHELFVVGLLPPVNISVAAEVCAMVLIYCFVAREPDIAEITIEGRSGTLRERCAQIAWRYHLSERESQVVLLLARGRNAARIQEELCLSKSTVSTHRQHVYEKLGIHTRQELIDLIEDF
jgi:DNA-binding CsgD family transcriptional regulator